ncbi:GNAT family N-acetyltransferase [Marinovum sp.]|uniref:GNAT family N-acetyltransferase n=1 Tax=Marinovum sp. TaxID=2024839 RepID=UPI002B2702DD|nr:GNAT family N-acetyltransferase [Marinovum sp.]
MQIRTLPDCTPEAADLIERHTTFCDGTAPPGSCHRLPAAALFAPEITVWGVFDPELIGIGALKQLSPTDGEIKSMHTRPAARGKGVARALLAAIVAEARGRGMTALWLETGVHPDFSAARSLYAAHGFHDCPPFGSYALDPHSTFMTLDLTAETAQ